MFHALRSLAALLLLVSLVCGAGAMAHGASGHGDMAQAAAAHDSPAPMHHGAAGTDGGISKSCAGALGHCGQALVGDGGPGAGVRVVMKLPRDLPADLSLVGGGPEFETPPPRG